MRSRLLAGAALAFALAGLAPAAEEKPQLVIQAAPVEQSAEAVAQVDWLDKAEHTTKLFSTTGGDPAINGVYLFMLVYPESMAEESTTFWIGDFNTYDIVEQTKEHVTLKIGRSWVEQESGEIKSVEEKWQVPMVPPGTKELKITLAP